MATVSFDALEALGRRPRPSISGTRVSGYVRFVTVNGPFKTEYNIYQQGANDSFATEDTFKTGLVTPIAVEAVGGPTSVIYPLANLEADPSQPTYGTVTVAAAIGEDGAGLIVKVHGF